ncbi:MAG TPA: hypothetical protein VEC35_20980 [Noviherbaspirillum sp.]|nr:hypothetical protein [Noviherbaspirillum sp.]
MTHHAVPHTYDPNLLFDTIMLRLGVHSDGALALHLKLARTVIRNIRSGHTPVSATIALMLQQATGMSLEELRALMGDRRASFRPAYCLSFDQCTRQLA